MKIRALLAVAAALFLATGTAQAAEVDQNSANFWLPHCKRDFEKMIGRDAGEISRAAYYSGTCFGIIQGAAHTLRINGMMMRHKAVEDNVMCVEPPKGVTAGQLRRVVIKRIEEEPERMHESFFELVEQALIYTWPCK